MLRRFAKGKVIGTEKMKTLSRLPFAMEKRDGGVLKPTAIGTAERLRISAAPRSIRRRQF